MKKILILMAILAIIGCQKREIDDPYNGYELILVDEFTTTTNNETIIIKTDFECPNLGYGYWPAIFVWYINGREVTHYQFGDFWVYYNEEYRLCYGFKCYIHPDLWKYLEPQDDYTLNHQIYYIKKK